MKRVHVLYVLSFALAMVCLVSLSSSLFGQAGTSFTLVGTVKDEQGGVLPGATVTVINESIGLRRSVVTNESGQYTLAGLPPTGTYQIQVEMPGFRTERQSGLQFEANRVPTIDFVLKVGAPSEVVTVTSAAPLVQRSQAQLSETVTEQKIEELPNRGRNFFDYVALAAGSVKTGGGSGNVTFNGIGRRNVTILTDGMVAQNREIRTNDLGVDSSLQLDVVKEVQVVTNNFSAEFGRSPSAVVNAITKSGTNQLHGSAYIYQRFGKLDASNPLTGSNSEVNRSQFGGVVGGPIVKDKTHFFGAVERIDQKEKAGNIVTILEPAASRGLVIVPDLEFQGLVKVDHQFNDSNHFDIRYNYSRGRQNNLGIGGFNTSERAFKLFTDDHRIVAGLVSIINPNVVNEARFMYSKNVFDDFQEQLPRQLPPDFSNLGPAVNRAGIGNTGPAPFLPQNLDERAKEFQDKISWNVGKHNLKFGADYVRYNRFVTFFNDFIGTYTFAPDTPFPFDINDPATYPVTFTQAFGTSGLRFKEWLIGTFIQDDFRVHPRLTLNLGLRYDYESILKDSNNFAPRIGLAWDVTGDGKTVVRAGYGHFFATIETSLINRESNFGPEGIKTIRLQQGDPLFPTFPNIFSAFPAGAVNTQDRVFIPIVRGLSEQDFPLSVGEQHPELRMNAYSQQATLGIQHLLTRDLVVSVDYTFVRGLKLGRTQDLNAPPFFEVGPGQTRSVAEADALRPYGVPSTVPGPLGIQFGGFRRLLLQDVGNQSFYHAMKINVTKRFSDRFTFEANYTVSKSISDSDNFRENDSLPTHPDNILADRGLSDTDRRHNFVANGLVDLPHGFRFSAIVNMQSGFPYTGRAGFDAAGIGNSVRVRPGLLGRNTFRSDAFYNFDTSIVKTFNFTEEQNLAVRMDVFNLFNHANSASVSQTLGLDISNPNANFGRVTSVAQMRTMQFSLKYQF